MTAQTAPGPAGVTIGGPAGPGPAREERPPSLTNRMVKHGIWLAVVTRSVGDRRFQAGVITGAIGMYALASMIKNNQARPVRRAVRWYNMEGTIGNMEGLHRTRRAVEPDKR